MAVEIIPVCFEDSVDGSTDLGDMIAGRIQLQDGDILVVSQKVVSKAEGRTVELSRVVPSLLASGIASQYRKDPRIVELVLAESRRIVRMGRGVLIVETHHGFICANAGIDESNVELGLATLLPVDADASARGLRHRLSARTGKSVAVLISDTFGRPFRMGQTDCAIGVSGIEAVRSYRGTPDTVGRHLRVSEIAISDELCAAAALVKGKASNCPVSVIRNFDFIRAEGSVRSLLRPEDEDLFR